MLFAPPLGPTKFSQRRDPKGICSVFQRRFLHLTEYFSSIRRHTLRYAALIEMEIENEQTT